MQALTGFTGFDWLLAAMYAFACALVVEGRVYRGTATRLFGIVAILALAGAGAVVALVLVFAAESRYVATRLADRPATLVALLATVAAAVAFAELLVQRVRPLAVWALRPLIAAPRLRGDVALVLAVMLPTIVAIGGLTRVDDRVPSGYALSQPASSGLELRETFELPGHPLDLELATDSSGYVSFGEGWIGRFELSGEANRLQIIRVADRLAYPRGLAVVGDTLYVGELGPLPCRPAFPSCKGGDVPGQSTEETEREILRTSRARILAYDILPDGALARRRVLVSGLPVANTDHGVNDIALGPDGRLYVSVGNLDRLAATPALAPDLARPHADLLGTVISVRTDGRDLNVVVLGLRNVYGLAFDRAGRLYGGDNDGPTRSGWRREELLVLEPGADHGFPDEGTFVPQTRRNTPPLCVLDAIGSGGIAWLADEQGAGMLLVGGLQQRRGGEAHCDPRRRSDRCETIRRAPRARPSGLRHSRQAAW
jgi:hypothetical protein